MLTIEPSGMIAVCERLSLLHDVIGQTYLCANVYVHGRVLAGALGENVGEFRPIQRVLR
ncbi:MAG: hypothetical protein ACI8W7_001901 [Gammaproteobacteria bacterium]|jgi:hypothetical protein